MVKRRRGAKGVWAFLIVLAIVMVAALGVLGYYGFSQAQFAGSGFTVTGISPTQVISNDADLKNANFLVTTVLDGAGQSVVGRISPQQFKSESGYEPSYDFEFGVNSVNEVAVYSVINNAPSDLKKYETSNYFCDRSGGIFNPFGLCTNNAQVCANSQEEVGRFYEGSLSFPIPISLKVAKRYCLNRNVYGTLADAFSNPSVQFSANLYMRRGTEAPLTKTINSATQKTVDFYSGTTFLGNAKWTGSLSTGNSPPITSQVYTPYFYDLKFNANSPDEWRIANFNNVQTYRSLRDTLEQQLVQARTAQGGVFVIFGSNQKSIQEMDNFIDDKFRNVNLAADTVISQDLSIGGAVPSGSLTTGKLTVPLSNTVGNPQIVWLVDAEWLGIKIPVGIPDITSANCPEFLTGTKTTCTVQVQNKGTGNGAFDVALESCDPFRMTSNPSAVTARPGETITLQFEIDAGSTGVNLAQQKTCSVRAYDANKPSNFDTMSVTLKSKPAAHCNVGEEKQQGECILACKADQSGFATKECCSEVILLNGKLVCKTLQCTVNSNCQSGFECKNNVCVSTGCSGTECQVCSKDSDCKTGELCTNNVCKEKKSDVCEWNWLNPGAFFACIINQLKIPLAAIAFIVGLLVTVAFTNNFKIFPPKQSYLGFIPGLVVGSALAYIIWVFLIPGIIIAIIALVVMGIFAWIGRTVMPFR